jgi:hypothetical protein
MEDVAEITVDKQSLLKLERILILEPKFIRTFAVGSIFGIERSTD